MPQKKPPPDWDAIAAAYAEHTATLKEIGDAYGVTPGAISSRAKKESWPARRRVTKKKRRPGATFEWRLARALDRQISELESRWADTDPGLDTARAEKEARTLSVLIRTAERLKDIETMSKTKTKSPKNDQAAHNDLLDRKRLRETLERRLDQLIAAAEASGISGEPDDE